VSGIHCAETLHEALSKRHRLVPGESIITRDGLWLGANWLRSRRQDEASGGILQRQQDIDSLREQLEWLETELNAGQTHADTLRTRISTFEQQRQQAQADVNRWHRSESEQRNRLHTLQQRIDQLSKRRQQIDSECAELATQQQQQTAEHEQATTQRDAALALLDTLQSERDQLAATREDWQHAVSDARRTQRDLQAALQDTRLQIETHRTQRDNSQQQLDRIHSRLELLEQQRETLLEQLQLQDDPLAELAEEREQALIQRADVEQRLTQARQQLQALEAEIRQQDSARVQAERLAETSRTALENRKLEWQSVQVREQTLAEQFAKTEFDSASLQAEFPANASAATFLQALENVQRSIQRLGAINLAAIDEFREQQERKHYLDQQNADLVTALETLETAIRKIDRETRARFKETFDKVNSRLGEMFSRLFGGGECYLDMTGDDLLTTGVAIMARPPGKRISTIYLMSGGEKALTAVALVFAIFELNPAPFCMLDEVDAPLDEANVGRFCELVRHMSEQVQFIFITHNKSTMELAENLIGVTMREAGVSRLVTVDMAEAVKLANS
jgi:chromosome segregation protein